jgi:hypothetical protein
MQKLLKAAGLSLFLFFIACNNNQEKDISQVNNVEEKQSFFPVTQFLLGQLNEIEGMPVTPVKITMSGGKKDSVWLKKEDIRSFAAPFLRPVIDSASMQKYFTEKSFLDQTINALTLSYDLKSSIPDSIKLNHWDVYIDPQKGAVQRIFLVKDEVVNGQNITTQLTWKVNKWCSIRRIVQEPKKEAVVTEEIMKWDFED